MAPKAKRSSIDLLIKQRENARANIERISDLIFNIDALPSIEELDCRLEIVETYFTQALEYQSSIEEFDNAGENANATNVRGELEDLYCSVKVRIRSLMKGKGENQTTKLDAKTLSSKLPENLPKLKLPTFSGKYSEFPNFIRLFRTLVDNDPRVSIIEKFNHLYSCLSGSALRTIKALDFTEANYESALALLENRFNNKHLMCQEHINELFQLNKVQKGSADQLRFLADTVAANFNALCSLLNYEELANVLIVHLVMSAVDSDTQLKLEESIDSAKPLNWVDCSKILTQRCQVLEARGTKFNSCEQKQGRQSAQKNFERSNKAVALSATNNYCNCCKTNIEHPLWKCSKFLEFSPMQRFDYTKKMSLCLNCLSSQHTVRQCKSSSCKHCKSPHHTLLHRSSVTLNNSLESTSQQSCSQHELTTQAHTNSQHPLSSKPQQQLGFQPQQQLGFQPQQLSTASSVQPSGNVGATSMVGQQIQSWSKSKGDNSQTILATAVIEIIDKNGNKQLVRALLDSASQLNFITKNCAQRLNLDKIKVATVIGGIGQSQTQAKYSITASIHSRITKFQASLQFLILPSITGLQPYCRIDSTLLKIPHDVSLADPQYFIPQKIDILIGADLFFDLFDGKQMKLGNNCPTLLRTEFGWVVSGKCKTPQLSYSLISSVSQVEPDHQLTELVKEFWAVEKVPDAKHKLSKEQEECENHFVENVKRLSSGRFELRLPFKQDPSTLGDSSQMAHRRFLSLEKKLSSNPNLHQAYVEFLENYKAEGHMTEIPWPTSFAGYYVMPHHCVLRLDKSTTKCRVVFDASAKSANNISLNDILKVGPVVQNELVDILWRFRLHRYGLMADIAAMYRQIWIHPNDSKVQNIIWRSNSSQSPKLYRLNTVTYGTASAPYLATRCLIHLANECEQQNANAAKIIKHDFYVDDLISGGSTLSEIQRLKQEVSEILERAGFHLRKWFSNHNEFLSQLSEDEKEKPIKINNSSIVKTLGISWDADSDSFKFSYDLANVDVSVITKRNVLSELSRIFDPLGLIKPITVKAKIFMQELWLKKLNWDESIPQECATAWIAFIKQLTDLNDIKIPRYVLLDSSKLQLHGFADASTRAYGCCFYVRCVDASGNIKVTLLTSRSKVSPISTVRSLPCLELCGAHLLAQLYLRIRTIINFHETFFWSDSVIVLQWLAEHASNFNTFVANRVSLIQEHTSGIQWRYVPSSANPADLVSRGATVSELISSIWFPGPQFLYKSKECWPQQPKQSKTGFLPERKTVKTVLLVTTNDLLEFIHSCSKFSKTCLTIAYIRRFIRNCRNKQSRNSSLSISITAKEFDNAAMNIISIIQKLHYDSEIFDLNQNRQVNQNSSIKALNPFVERVNEFTILKVGGRLKNAKLPYITKCPIILPKNDAFVESYGIYTLRTVMPVLRHCFV